MAERAPDALVVFTPSGRRGRFPIGTPLLQAARALGVDLDSVCGGRGLCGRCQILHSTGEFAKLGIHSRPEHLGPLSEPEKRFGRKAELLPGRRLSCYATLQGDAVIDVPATSQIHRQVVRKAHQRSDLQVDPLVHLHYVEIDEPHGDHPGADLERLLRALDEQWQMTQLVCDPHVLPTLQRSLGGGEPRVTVAVRQRREVIGVWPGFRSRALGVAADVGSTTLAAHLCDLASGELLASAGAANPQIRFGEDLMSRVSYAMLNPGGEEDMTRAVREALDALVATLAEQAGATPDDVLEMTFVGNSVMHHLLLGISPVSLGSAPFRLAWDGPTTRLARDLGIAVHPGARAYVLPCIDGHVGADAAGVLLAEAPWKEEGVTLLVDVGTNAEIILSGRGRLLAASSPTGPAFEGAQISCGQRAAPGAIERVRIDPETLEPRFQVIGCGSWSDEPDFDDALGRTGVTGICGTGIIEAIAELHLAGVIDRDGRIDGACADRSPRVLADGRTHSYLLRDGSPPVRILQKDVRAIQLAKAALYAGVQLLMDHLGVDRVDRIRLAGAFGSQIDGKYAMVLGMIPDCDPAFVSSAGNAAGTGALATLLDGSARDEIERRVSAVERIETAMQASFQEHFVGAMALPHATHRFPKLGEQVVLPEPGEVGRGRARRRRSPAGGRRS
jgi:uncharacterized 2Fe-2S/4Fe-4S cluster protein (DUF4445 family)